MNDMQLRFDPSRLPRDPVGPMPDMRMSNPEPVEATRAVMPEPNYSGGLGSLMGGMSGSVPYPSSPKFNQPKTTLSPDQELEMQRYVAQRQGAEIENQRKAADLQRLRSQPYDPRQLIG
jgi:hypothetical protein